MPGAMEHVEGEIHVFYESSACSLWYEVQGLQAILEKWVGKRVSITVEEIDE